jgi:two-component system nitrate/nitrite response regulator NarL
MVAARPERDARPMPLRIVIADDHPLFREGIVRTLENDPRFVVVGEAGDGAEAEALIRLHDPELALLDLRMPGMDGLELLARLRHRTPPLAVVVLTAYTDASLVQCAIDAGAAAYVAKDRDRAEILDVIAAAAAKPARGVLRSGDEDA